MKELLARFGLMAAALALAFGLMEIAARALPVRQKEADTRVRATARPPLSMLDPELRNASWSLAALEHPPGILRIVAVGDSFTWGDGVHAEDAWPARLERRANALPGSPPVEVLNWSRRGWNTRTEWLSLERYLSRLEPDLVVLGYCLNDPSVLHPRESRRSAGVDRRRPTTPVARWLHAHSRLYHGLYEGLESRRQHRAFGVYYASMYEAERPARQQQLRVLKKWSVKLRRRHIPMLLVVFPVFTTEMGSEYPYRELHEIVTADAEHLRIPALDLLPAYSGIDPRRLAAWPFLDRHPSELAHRIAADSILRELRRRQMLPAVSG